MCTAIAQFGKKFLFGRNLDLEYGFNERATRVPRRVPLRFFAEQPIEEHYAMIGMASQENDFPLFADGMNERGLCAAGLNFPESAVYAGGMLAGAYNVAPHELIAWILAKCASVDEAEQLLRNTRIVAVPYKEYPVAPLHWAIADRKRCIIAEPRAEGLRIFDNPTGVLTNEPPFEFHAHNLRNYLNLTARFPQERFASLGLRPCSVGAGAFGLPGDCTSASRFVRAAYYVQNSAAESSDFGDVSQFFHILSSVEMPRGGVFTAGDAPDYTRYSCCMDTERGAYFFRTYGNARLRACSLRTDGESPEQIEIGGGEDVLFLD